MRGLETSTIGNCSSYILMTWSLDCLRCLFFNGVCLIFSIGKQHQDPFPKYKFHRASSPFDLVHSDLMIFLNPSFIGSWYALMFIDNLLKFTWIYFLKYKSGVFSHLKFLKALVENQSSSRIKKLPMDNGGVLQHRVFKVS